MTLCLHVRLPLVLAGLVLAAPSRAAEPEERRPEEAVAAAIVPTPSVRDQDRPPSPIAAPSLSDWRPRLEALGPAHREEPFGRYRVLAVATDFDLPIYKGWGRSRRVSGRTFRGSAFSSVSIKKRCSENGRRGRWYAISTPGHFVCSASGYKLTKRNGRLTDQLDPTLERPLPYRYARVTEDGTIRLKRLPENEEELELLRARAWGKQLPGWFAEEMKGDYFVALDREFDAMGEKFYRTVRHEFVRSDALKLRTTPPMQGEHLDGHKSLPIAFVYGEEPVELKCKASSGSWKNCGQAYKHDRMGVEEMIEIEGRDFAVGPRGYAAPADRLRVAKKRRRPSKVRRKDKWIHVDLAEQTLVAYEGDEPVFATLVSSGKKGYETPSGLYRIQRKYTTKRMRGNDKDTGLVYHIEDIPWIMYYFHTYALHGAYWHNTFGQVRSHGCTNLAPADARWLYLWASPKVRWGWHARYSTKGTYVLFES